MYILSLETSTKVFSLAVSKDQKILRYRNIRTDKILESSIIPAIDKLLSACGISLSKIDAIAVGLGPGSFTSLRVGVSTVKGLAMAANKKVIGIGSLDILASAVANQTADEICTLLDARRGKVYAAIYNKNLSRKTDYLLTTMDDVLERVHGKTLFVGDGIGIYRECIIKAYKDCAKKKSNSCQPIFAAEKFWYPQAQELAKLALQKLLKQEVDDSARIVPIYLYPEDCQVDRK